MRSHDVLTAMQQIKLLLERAPDSAETAEGIHNWWIPWDEPAPGVEVTQEALNRLEREGIVRREKNGHGELWRGASS